MRALALLVALATLPIAFPLAAGARDDATHRFYDEKGRIAVELGVDADDTRVGYARYYHYAADAARPGGGGGPALTDCTSAKYALGGWRWSGPVSFTTTAYAAEFAAALATWDAATSGAIAGTVTSGAAGSAGVYDGVNQIDWAALGSGGTIAVTTTWYYRSSGEAVESDAQYNSAYAWANTGAPGAMDVQNIATHEIGHTFGLDHPRGKSIGCLTMYAYGSYGETQKRTLGDGDMLGIRALYGN